MNATDAESRKPENKPSSESSSSGSTSGSSDGEVSSKTYFKNNKSKVLSGQREVVLEVVRDLSYTICKEAEEKLVERFPRKDGSNEMLPKEDSINTNHNYTTDSNEHPVELTTKTEECKNTEKTKKKSFVRALSKDKQLSAYRSRSRSTRLSYSGHISRTHSVEKSLSRYKKSVLRNRRTSFGHGRDSSTTKRSVSRDKDNRLRRRIGSSRSHTRSHSRFRRSEKKLPSRSPRRIRSQERRHERRRSMSSDYERIALRRSEPIKRRDKDEFFKNNKKVSGDIKKGKGNDNGTVAELEAKITERQRKSLDILTSRTGGACLTPDKLRMIQAEITDKSSAAYQSIAREALKKYIHGYINKVNVDSVAVITRKLLKDNIVRGRGVLCHSIIQAQATSPKFTHVYAAMVAIINSKFPNIGELLLKRLVIQFKRAFGCNDKTVCLTSSHFIAHLVNQRVAHEILALEILTLLIESPTDDNVEVAITFLKECGMKLTEVSSDRVGGIFELLKNILHQGKLDKRVQYMIKVLFQVRRDGFKDHQSIIESLELVEEYAQFTHLLLLEDVTYPKDILNEFKFDDQYETNEEKYKALSKNILGSHASDSDGSFGSGSNSETALSDCDKGKNEVNDKYTSGDIIDETKPNLIALRRTIYLTLNSCLDYEECAQKLMKMQLKTCQQNEFCQILLDCCAEQRTYEKFYGLLTHRICKMNKSFIEPFKEIFKDICQTTHCLDTNRLRNISKFFAHLLFTDAISWDVLDCIKLTEDEAITSRCIFIKSFFQELVEYMGLYHFNKKLKTEVLAGTLAGLFPKDNPRNIRFSINFFTSIGLGGITNELCQLLKIAPKSAPSSSSSSSLSSELSAPSDDDSSSDSENKKKHKGKNKKMTKKKNPSKKKEKTKKIVGKNKIAAKNKTIKRRTDKDNSSSKDNFLKSESSSNESISLDSLSSELFAPSSYSSSESSNDSESKEKHKGKNKKMTKKKNPSNKREKTKKKLSKNKKAPNKNTKKRMTEKDISSSESSISESKSLNCSASNQNENEKRKKRVTSKSRTKRVKMFKQCQWVDADNQRDIKRKKRAEYRYEPLVYRKRNEEYLKKGGPNCRKDNYGNRQNHEISQRHDSEIKRRREERKKRHHEKNHSREYKRSKLGLCQREYFLYMCCQFYYPCTFQCLCQNCHFTFYS
ncbi:male determiner protein Mdmd(Y) [Musca domestica]|uniref:Male determiner protein Mdmd(Y) n=1 Tax=Musca domestica TaxID=7370 RepID=A0ABM3UZ74_MUSDO|nr:male determiner protein Mdmd(Y) [Musca domestica]